MPSSTDALRKKFMTGGTDGCDNAENIITKAGGKIIQNGYIYLPKNLVITEDISDALLFLVHEWDYIELDPATAVRMLTAKSECFKAADGNVTFVAKNRYYKSLVSWLVDYLKSENYQW